MAKADLRGRVMRGYKQSERGITLVELMVAITILSITTVATVRGMNQSFREAQGGTQRVLAQTVALNRAEELKLFGPARADSLPDQVAMGAFLFSVDTEFERTEAGLLKASINARSEDGIGAFLVVYLTPLARS